MTEYLSVGCLVRLRYQIKLNFFYEFISLNFDIEKHIQSFIAG